MNTSTFIIALLLCVALILTFFFPPVGLASDRCWVEYAWPDCDDGNLLNGYWWRGGWVPGMITVETHFTPAPQFISGAAVYYAPGLMEATARYRGLDLSGYVDGVAMMSCSDIGQEVWIWEGWSWDGPFLVVDCAEWDDMWPVTVHRNEVVEVGWKTAIRWGMIERDEYTKPVYVWKGKNQPRRINREVILVSYKSWFLENAEYLPASMIGLPRRPIFFPPHKWWINGEWIDFVETTRFDNNVSRYYIGVRNMVLGP